VPDLESHSPLSPLLRGNCFDRTCPGRAILAHVTGRWGTLVLAALKVHGTLRFSQLRDRIDGISEKMLSQTLRELETDRLVRRISLPVVPPHVEYDLTPMGLGVAGHLEALIDWIETHIRELADIAAAAP
jgi:DNA-binding HxlR family transcriptional regulator